MCYLDDVKHIDAFQCMRPFFQEIIYELPSPIEELDLIFSFQAKFINIFQLTIIIIQLQDCPEVHANAAEALCAITRYAPPGITSKISSPR